MGEGRISGTIAAAVTPLREDGERLDEGAVAPLLEFYRASGIEGVLVLGTTGEGILLGREERRRAAELAIADAGELRVIVHCGAQTTAETRALADPRDVARANRPATRSFSAGLLVARGAHHDAIAARGLTLATPQERVPLRVAVQPTPRAVRFGDDDVVLLATKSQDTEGRSARCVMRLRGRSRSCVCRTGRRTSGWRCAGSRMCTARS
jgi:hypothetical protein